MEPSARARLATASPKVTMIGWPTPTGVPDRGCTSTTLTSEIGADTAAEPTATHAVCVSVTIPSKAKV